MTMLSIDSWAIWIMVAFPSHIHSCIGSLILETELKSVRQDDVSVSLAHSKRPSVSFDGTHPLYDVYFLSCFF